MSTFEEFKEFIKDKPYLKDKVKNNKTTWQELYERYDLYGKEPVKEEETNKKDDKEEKDDSLSSFINMISGLDVDKISDGLNGMKKILNILSEITVNDDVSSFTSARRNQRPYKRDDD